MFKSLLKRLFSAKPKKQANYYYFEQGTDTPEAKQQEVVSEFQQSLDSAKQPKLSIEQQYQQDFYDFLFGESQSQQQHDELSAYVGEQIEKLLSHPKYILNNLPILPASLTKVIEHLNDDDFDADELIDLIQKEPVIAGKVIELANSFYYNQSDKEISDLKSAFMMLGVKGLTEGVINGFVSKLTPQSQIYFRQYGNKIWQHCFNTGMIAKELINNSALKEEASQGYLIGLVSNIGDMIIFQLLMESFAYIHPDSEPNSHAFKTLLAKNSKKITYYVAKHWSFPPSILDSLALQAKLSKASMLPQIASKRPIGCFVYEAKLLSELSLRFANAPMSEEHAFEIKNELIFSQQAKDYLEQKLINRD